jgi:hypothetical protein
MKQTSPPATSTAAPLFSRTLIPSWLTTFGVLLSACGLPCA